MRDFEKISAGNIGIVFLVFDSAGGKIECREMRREQRNVTAVDFLKQRVMILAEILMPPSAALLFREPGFAVIGSNQKAARTASRVDNDIASAPYAKRVDDIDDVFVGIELTEFLPLFR